MKRILLIVSLLCVTTAFSQTYYFKKAITVKTNQALIDYYTENIAWIASVGGKKVIEIPCEIDVKKNVKSEIIDNFLVQYEVTRFAGKKSITIFPSKCRVYEFNFEKNTIKKRVSKASNAKSVFRPVDLKKRLEKTEKLKPKEIKPKEIRP